MPGAASRRKLHARSVDALVVIGGLLSSLRALPSASGMPCIGIPAPTTTIWAIPRPPLGMITRERLRDAVQVATSRSLDRLSGGGDGPQRGDIAMRTAIATGASWWCPRWNGTDALAKRLNELIAATPGPPW